MQITEKHIAELIEEVGRCRARVMDDFELEIGDSPRWPAIRARLLKVFGHRGLEGKVIELLSADRAQVES